MNAGLRIERIFEPDPQAQVQALLLLLAWRTERKREALERERRPPAS